MVLAAIGGAGSDWRGWQCLKRLAVMGVLAVMKLLAVIGCWQ